MLCGVFALGSINTSAHLPIKKKKAEYPYLFKDPEPLIPKSVVTIPLKRVGKLLLIEATIDGLTGNFIFDTGAPYPVLNATYFRDRSSREKSNYYAQGINGELDAVRTLKIRNLYMGNILYQNLNADLAELGHIENARGIKILGLLGLNLFKSFELEIDLEASTLKLYALNEDGFAKQPTKETYDFTVPIEVFDNSIFLDCSIGGDTMRFGLDTGAEINALCNSLSSEILSQVSISGRSKLTGTNNDQVDILFGRIRDFNLGETSFAGMQTVITPLSGLSDGYGTVVCGVLGYELLLRGKVRLNFKRSEMGIRIFNNFRNS
jgi:hypothetical protein